MRELVMATVACVLEVSGFVLIGYKPIPVTGDLMGWVALHLLLGVAAVLAGALCFWQSLRRA